MRTLIEYKAVTRLTTNILRARPVDTRARQRGQALLVLVLMMSVATTLLVYGSTTAASRAVKSDSRIRATLDEAKQALIGRAIADANRPGSLPCPDNDDDGSADFFSGSACASYIGRLPWRTLGIGDLRDEGGERLWYAISPGFRDHPLAPPLNSDTRGALTVYSNTTDRVVARDAIAIVFAPGAALAGQRRDTGLAFCATTARDLPRNRCAANYLDSIGTLSNARTAGPYMAAFASESFNDKLAVIVSADVMPLVERRVAIELREALLAYKATVPCRCYPWADATSDGVSDVGANRGRVPTTSALPHPWPPRLLPAYFATNEWSRLIYYTAAKDALETAGASCKTCTDSELSLDGVAGQDVLLFTPGFAEKKRSPGAWSDYLDDPENRDADDRFVTPRSLGAGRDHVFAIGAAKKTCAANAQVLIDNSPCASPGNALRGVCSSALIQLASCTCASAAATLAKAPCSATLEQRECEAAVTQLRRCTS